MNSLPSLKEDSPVLLNPEFVDEVRSDLLCPVCSRVLHEPIQTKCGHRLCLKCFQALTSNGSVKCPGGEEDCVNLEQGQEVYPDFNAKREIKRLQVYCPNKTHGCKYQSQLAKMEEHLTNCQFALKACPYHNLGCQEQVTSETLDDHVKSCDFHPEVCEYCKKTFPACKLKHHVEELCPEYIMECPHHCGEKGLRKHQLPSHEETCSKRIIQCRFKHHGCQFEGTMSEVKEHEENGVKNHLDVLLNYISLIENKNGHLEKQLQDVERDCGICNAKCDNIARDKELLEIKLKSLQASMQAIQKVSATNREAVDRLNKDFQNCVKKDDLHGQTQQLSTIQKQHRDMASRLTSIEELSRSMDSGIGRSGSLSSEVTQHDQLLSMINIRMSEVDLRLQMVETASYNGTLVWKIRGYARRKADAIAGRTMSLYSQPFYTSPHGYKMCARVYLNGDGIGKGTHLSLFFVVMKGDYDALLPWPFNQKVRLMLLDQSGGGHHLQDMFRPDPGSTSFQRPQNDMNVASGCPLFAAQSALEAPGSKYVRDDVLFIKVVVEGPPVTA